jgi:glycosyltransferase involved in cell wall biosynthesis
MKALHLIDHMGPGGAQGVVLDCLELASPDIEVAALSLRDRHLPGSAARMAAVGQPFRGLGVRPSAPLSVLRLREALAREAADVIHTHLEASGTLGTMLVRTLGRGRPLLVNHIHNDPTQKFSLPHRALGRLFARTPDAHVVSTPSIGRAVRRCFGRGIRRMEIVPYGIDADAGLAASGSRDSERPDGSPVVIGAVGRLVPQKAHHLLLRATPRILAARPTARIRIAGGGPLEGSLREEARRLGIAAAVEFLGQVADVNPIYAALDVFVLPSRFEATSLALLEAMAAGVPVVSTRIVGVSDVITDGVNGLLAVPGDPDALADAILRVLDDAALRSTLRANARRTIERDHTRTQMVERIETLYRSLLASAPRG